MNAHIHAENMRLYAEDATKTDKPWELWEFKSLGMEDWQTLESNPTWGFATEYRREVKEADPRGADALDAERYRWLRDKWFDNEPESINMGRAKGQCGLDASVDAAIAQQRRINERSKTHARTVVFRGGWL